MDKLRYMKTPWTNFKEFLRPSRYLYQPKFEDRYLQNPPKFKHDWNQMAHMHDLRVWTLAYAPTRWMSHTRLQEIHHLNQEMWYQVSKAYWTRFFIAVPLFFIMTRWTNHIRKRTYNNDSHDANFREVTAHM